MTYEHSASAGCLNFCIERRLNHMENNEAIEIMSEHLKKLSEVFDNCSEASEMLEITQAMIGTAGFITAENRLGNSG